MRSNLSRPSDFFKEKFFIKGNEDIINNYIRETV